MSSVSRAVFKHTDRPSSFWFIGICRVSSCRSDIIHRCKLRGFFYFYSNRIVLSLNIFAAHWKQWHRTQKPRESRKAAKVKISWSPGYPVVYRIAKRSKSSKKNCSRARTFLARERADGHRVSNLVHFY